MLKPDEILGWTPDKMRIWLRTHPSEADFHWLALGEGAAMAATSSAEVETTKRDALGDVALYAFKMATRLDERSCVGVLLSELTLRAGLIERLGAASGTLRDEEELLKLICHEVESAEDVKHKLSEGPVDLLNSSVLSGACNARTPLLRWELRSSWLQRSLASATTCSLVSSRSLVT